MCLLELLNESQVGRHFADLVLEKVIKLCVLFVFVDPRAGNEIFVTLTLFMLSENLESPSFFDFTIFLSKTLFANKACDELLNGRLVCAFLLPDLEDLSH